MFTFSNYIIESSNFYSEYYGPIDKSKIVENISFVDVNDKSKKITLPVTFIVESKKAGLSQFWKRVKEGNKKQLKTLKDLKSNPLFIKNGFNDLTLKKLYDEWECEHIGESFEEFKKKFFFIEILITELGHLKVRYAIEKGFSMDEDITFFKAK